MKVRALFSIAVLLAVTALSTVTRAQIASYSTFSSYPFAVKLSTNTDTSATITIGSYPYVSIATTTTGCDSSHISVAVDGLVNGVWSNNLTSQALTLGKPAGYTLASTKGQVANFFIRIPSAADATQSCNQIRIRNVHSAMAAGSTDSTSATTYTQRVILR